MLDRMPAISSLRRDGLSMSNSFKDTPCYQKNFSGIPKIHDFSPWQYTWRFNNKIKKVQKGTTYKKASVATEGRKLVLLSTVKDNSCN